MTEETNQRRGFARNIKYREAEIDVSDVEALDGWFVEGEPHVLRVRQLNGREFCIAELARARATNSEALLAALQGQLPDQLVETLREALHLNDPAQPDLSPAEYYHRMAVVRLGLVFPEMTEAEVVQLQEYCGVVWLAAFRKIMELSGQGGVTRGKSKRSTETRAS